MLFRLLLHCVVEEYPQFNYGVTFFLVIFWANESSFLFFLDVGPASADTVLGT